MDPLRSLGPAALDRVGEGKTQLGKANSDLEALIESICPADTNVKRHVIPPRARPPPPTPSGLGRARAPIAGFTHRLTRPVDFDVLQQLLNTIFRSLEEA